MATPPDHPPQPRDWLNLQDWAGATVFVLGMGISVGFAVSAILAVLPRTGAVGSAGEGILTLLAGGMIAIVSGYLGGIRRRRRDDEEA